MTYLRLLLCHLLLFTSICGTPPSTPPNITVVGAGLAGLTAAYRLQKLGYQVDVFEARGRPGGRVCTVFFGDCHEELGGKNLYDGGEARNILALIDELSLSATPYTVDAKRLYVLKGRPYSTPFLTAPKPTDTALQALNMDSCGARTLEEVIDIFLADYPLPQDIMKIMMRQYEGSSTLLLDSAYLHSLFWWMYEICYENSDEIAHGLIPKTTWCCVDGGNYRLVEALTKALEGHIHYNSVLTELEQNSDGVVKLQFRDGKVVTSSCLILALPCSTLRDVRLQDGLLPSDQSRAIQTLQYGTNAKMLFPVKVTGEDIPAFIFTHNIATWLNQDKSVTTWYYGGEPGIFDTTSVEALSHHISKDLPAVRMAMPDIEFTHGIIPEVRHDALVAHYSRPIGISWIDEEFSKGSYCNYGVGQYGLFNEKTASFGETVRKVFRPVGRSIFFAGEHTALHYSASMEGAVESGERTARMVQRVLGAGWK